MLTAVIYGPYLLPHQSIKGFHLSLFFVYSAELQMTPFISVVVEHRSRMQPLKASAQSELE